MGASSGIGHAVAEALASRGVKVGLAARHTTALAELKKLYPDNVEYMSIDVSHRNAPEKLNELIQRLGGMDIYFHVAGIGFDNEELDPERDAEMITVNAAGFTRMICAAYSYFRSHPSKIRPLIAAITSVAGTNGIGNMAAYSASKKCAQTYLTAIEQLSRSEHIPVDFTDMRPGWIRTPLIDPDKSYMMEQSVEDILPKVIRALVRRPRVTYLDWRWTALATAWRGLPDRAWVRVGSMVKSFR